jgi:hypothetical protein
MLMLLLVHLALHHETHAAVVACRYTADALLVLCAFNDSSA